MKKLGKNCSWAVLILLVTTQFLLSQSRVETRSFYSNSLDETKYYKVYLPDGYDQSTEHYPVVYFLRNHEEEWFSGNYPGRIGSALKEVIDHLIENGLIGKMIIVGPNTGSNSGDYSCCTVNLLRPDFAPASGIGTGKFEDYFLNDLIMHIDTTFRTIPDKEHRGIDGFSLGGYSSTCFGLRNPEVLSSVGSYDGSIMWKNLDDPNIPGSGPDDPFWFIENPNIFLDHIFDLPRNIPYMLQHSASDILENADTTQLNLIRKIRFHISESFCEGNGNHLRNLQLLETMRNKNIRNSWGNPVISLDASHDYGFADEHATASLIKHWQTFNGTKISAPTFINFSITEAEGKDYEIVVFNYGPGTLTINSITTGTSVFQLEDLPALPVTISSENDSISFLVSFFPPAKEYYTDTVFITSDDPVTPLAKIILRGKGGSYRAEPGVLYALSSNQTNLYSINVNTFEVDTIGPYGRGWTNINLASVDPFSKELIALSNRWYPYPEIVRINSQGGDVFRLVMLNSSESFKGVAFGSDDLLYLCTWSGKIFNLDPYCPMFLPPLNQVASTNLPLTSLAFNPITGQCWAAVGNAINRDRIYKIDINSGDTMYIGKTGLNEFTNCLAFDYQGNLYGLIGTTSNTLISIDTATGVGTVLSSLGNLGLTGIAMSPDYPNYVEQNGKPVIPSRFYLQQNYPNPFNPNTMIKYSIPEVSKVMLKLYNLLGEEVTTLVNEEKVAGYYMVEFNAANLPSGVYFYRIQAGEFVQTKKMILLK